jgi:hypothetical protein
VGILPIVDDSQQNLDFTFGAAKAYLDPTITNSNRINTKGKAVTFQIITGYFNASNPPPSVTYIKDNGKTNTACPI